MKKASVQWSAESTKALEQLHVMQARFREPGAVEALVSKTAGLSTDDATNLVNEVLATTDAQFLRQIAADKRGRLTLQGEANHLSAGSLGTWLWEATHWGQVQAENAVLHGQWGTFNYLNS